MINVQNGARSLVTVDDDLTNVANYGTKLDMEVSYAFKQWLKIRLDWAKMNAQKALDSARNDVEKLKDISDELISILESGSTDEIIKSALKKFVQKCLMMEKSETKAIERLVTSGAELTKGISNFFYF